MVMLLRQRRNLERSVRRKCFWDCRLWLRRPFRPTDLSIYLYLSHTLTHNTHTHTHTHTHTGTHTQRGERKSEKDDKDVSLFCLFWEHTVVKQQQNFGNSLPFRVKDLGLVPELWVVVQGPDVGVDVHAGWDVNTLDHAGCCSLAGHNPDKHRIRHCQISYREIAISWNVNNNKTRQQTLKDLWMTFNRRFTCNKNIYNNSTCYNTDNNLLR